MATPKYKLLPNILLKSDGLIHATHILERNFTFCGLASTEQDEEYTETNDKINCPICILFIDYCKNFKQTDFKRNKT